MSTPPYSIAMQPVAPLAGSVDRNQRQVKNWSSIKKSLPSRGAWIEISGLAWMRPKKFTVAPLAGSVDRNPYALAGNLPNGCRSPRGERG